MNILLTPARIGTVEIRNRIVMPPMTTRTADEDGHVTDDTVAYYLARARGGYRLGRPSSLISVADIIQAIDGPLTVTACSTGADNCGQYAKCSVRDPLWRLKDRIVAALVTCSLQEIATDPPLEEALTPLATLRRS